MVSTGKKMQSNSRLLSPLDGSDQDAFAIFGKAASDSQQSVAVDEDTNGRSFTAIGGGKDSANNENLGNVQTLERFFKEMINKEVGNLVDTIEHLIQNRFLTAIDSIMLLKLK